MRDVLVVAIMVFTLIALTLPGVLLAYHNHLIDRYEEHLARSQESKL